MQRIAGLWLVHLLAAPATIRTIVRYILAQPRACGYSMLYTMVAAASPQQQRAGQHLLKLLEAMRRRTPIGQISNATAEYAMEVTAASALYLSDPCRQQEHALKADATAISADATLAHYIEQFMRTSNNAVDVAGLRPPRILPELLIWAIDCVRFRGALLQFERRSNISASALQGPRTAGAWARLWSHAHLSVPWTHLFGGTPAYGGLVQPILNRLHGELFARRERFCTGTPDECIVLSDFQFGALADRIYDADIWLLATLVTLVQTVARAACALTLGPTLERIQRFLGARAVLYQWCVCIHFVRTRNLNALYDAGRWTCARWREGGSSASSEPLDSLDACVDAIVQRGVLPYALHSGAPGAIPAKHMPPARVVPSVAGDAHAMRWHALAGQLEDAWKRQSTAHVARALNIASGAADGYRSDMTISPHAIAC